MKHSLTLCLCLALLIITSESKCQQLSSVNITADFKSSTLAGFADQLESKARVIVYIDPALEDSIPISLKVTNATVKELLEQAFQNTGILFEVDSERHVFLTKGKEIEVGLPPDFFNDELNPSSPSNHNTLPDYSASGTNEPDGKLTGSNWMMIGSKENRNRSNMATVTGTIRNFKTGESLPGVSVVSDDTHTGVSSDPSGKYSISLPQGDHFLSFSYMGMNEVRRAVRLISDGKLDVEMQERVITLKGINISADQGINIRRVQMGVDKLTAQAIKQIPTLFGEKDILKVALSLPGVKAVNEASIGFNVRGGSSDQNLILFNNSTIYNPTHLFGFFSAINSDVVKDIQLYKSCIPPKYGGRLSSLLEITSREGIVNKFSGTIGIGLLTSHLTLEGPIFKGKTSFLLGVRTTYSDWLLNQIPKSSGYTNSSASFYDLNLSIYHQFNQKNNLLLSAYRSQDKFNLGEDTSYNYLDNSFSMRWRHLFSSKCNGVIVTGYDEYKSGNSNTATPVSAYDFTFDIHQLFLKADFNYYFNPGNTLNFGINTLHYRLNPGSYQPVSSLSLVKPDRLQTEQALESAFYVNEEIDLTRNLTADAGIRYSLYNFLGPAKIFIYQPNQPRTASNIIDSTSYSRGKTGKRYYGPEYRLSVRWALSEDLSLKAGYNTLRQYLHMISNTAAMSPTDIWKLSDPNIKPQYGDQLSLGIYKNFRSNSIETSIEIYYKHIQDYLDYKNGAVLLMNHHLETEVYTTRGKAYGVEFMFKKVAGKLNGWFSYTYSRTFIRMDDALAGEEVNHGNYYPAGYDKPHDFSLVGNYKFTHRYSISLNMTYSTGRPFTMIIGKFYFNGGYRAIYSERNAFRVPDYFRADLSMNIDGNHKIYQLVHGFWTFGIYNLTGRKNPYSIYFITSSTGQLQGYKLSIFGSAIPFVTYTLKF